ncbi:MAG TPA: hypothetical protein VMT91_00400 [Anaerolineales bacterium]|nr:hypothetical protein [Anaerolineales bacterium]
MTNQSRRFFLVNIALVLALVVSMILLPAMQTQAAAVLPNMVATLLSGGSTYTSTVYTGKVISFQANVKNVGNVPLQITATLTPPANWDVNDKYDNCGTLAAGSSCTLTWLFTPQTAGQVYLRVYVRGSYTDANGNAARITGAPAFFFNVLPTYSWQIVNNGSISTNTSTVPPAMLFPSMSVTLTGNDVATYAETVPTGKQFIFRAIVENTSNIPLQVVANLAVPTGWGVTQNMFNSCPSTANLAHKQSCEISWYFNPLVTGQVYLRVYVRAYYLDVYGNTQRITQAPAFIVNVVP